MDTPSSDSQPVDPELIARLRDVYGLDSSLAERIVEDILLAYEQTAEEWIRSRHIRLQRQGLRNEVIYKTIAEEIPGRRFASEPLSLRQIRRMIYG